MPKLEQIRKHLLTNRILLQEQTHDSTRNIFYDYYEFKDLNRPAPFFVLYGAIRYA